jgi:hypothetical protein
MKTVGMEDMLELTKKSCELTIFSNSKNNTRRSEKKSKNLRWCIPAVAKGWGRITAQL